MNKGSFDYYFYDGMIDKTYKFNSLEKLVKHCKNDIKTWVDDRDNNWDINHDRSFYGWFETLKNYKSFLDSISNLENEEKVINGVLEMYSFLNNGAKWGIQLISEYNIE